MLKWSYFILMFQVRRDLNGKVLKETTDDETLPICWKGIKQFKNIHDINHYFKTLFLSFTRQVQLQIPPEAYLIISVSTF